MTSISSADFRQHLGDVLDRVAFGKERVLLTRRGRQVAAVVPVEELEALERSTTGSGSEPDTASAARAVRGRYSHVPTSSEGFAARKRVEKSAEDR
jgi:prevent-host-death family protein